jgi:hypothetical protein
VHAMALGAAAFLEQALYALVEMLIDWARSIHQRRLARRASPKTSVPKTPLSRRRPRS